MVFDCFTFYDELDILEIRLHILDSVVDRFIIIEANETFTGMAKDYVFEKNKSRFEKFLPKIIYIPMVFPEFPQKNAEETRWARENYQRNQMALGLEGACGEDVILISDVDEIPSPQSIQNHRHKPGIKALDMLAFYFYLNALSKYHIWTHGTKMLFYKDFLSILDDVGDLSDYGVCFQSDVNIGTTATKIRLYEGKHQRHFFPSGWHFSYMGGEQKVIQKLDSFSHQEWREQIPEARTEAKRMMSEKKPFGYELVGFDLAFCSKKGLLPGFVIAHQDKYPHLFAKDNLKKSGHIIFISRIILIKELFIKKLKNYFKYLIKATR
ncbi:hypothetical protein [Helicobacter sp. 11S02596-1]|uniref:hypothetical protein n=1 Tax=Helicobacter sp. 11S02596-1 TaxID=1476194 RepID=UPI000BA6E861|nr:hypothetical protein [Helicobacter sp. 11S02596-1]PAF42808.1 hypothetical protein BJI48_06010 [Helicobacter sp. 11S02596-1]